MNALLEGLQDHPGQVRQSLSWLHQVEIPVSPKPKSFSALNRAFAGAVRSPKAGVEIDPGDGPGPDKLEPV